MQLPEGEIAKLPAHVQQALPDIQRQRDAFDREFAAVAKLSVDIAGFKGGAKILPVGGELAGRNGHTGGRLNFTEDRRPPAIEMRQRKAQATDQ
ncbi:hypothetical protein D3C73_1181190 [compost metagenome]